MCYLFIRQLKDKINCKFGFEKKQEQKSGPLDHNSCYRTTPTLGATTSTFAKLSPVTLPSLEFGAPQRGFGLHRKVNRENLTVPSPGCMGGRLPGPKATMTLSCIDKHQITITRRSSIYTMN